MKLNLARKVILLLWSAFLVFMFLRPPVWEEGYALLLSLGRSSPKSDDISESVGELANAVDRVADAVLRLGRNTRDYRGHCWLWRNWYSQRDYFVRVDYGVDYSRLILEVLAATVVLGALFALASPKPRASSASNEER